MTGLADFEVDRDLGVFQGGRSNGSQQFKLGVGSVSPMLVLRKGLEAVSLFQLEPAVSRERT